MPFPRRRPVPATVKALRLPPGERRTTWGLTVDGEEWSQVERANWQPPRLTVLEVAEVAGAGPRHVLDLDDVGDLPQVVRAQVTGSVAWSSHEKLTPAGGVRVVGRRVAGERTLRWQLVFDAGTDRHDPLVRAQADDLLEGARRSIG